MAQETTGTYPVTIPDYTDKADIVLAFTDYHIDIETHLDTKANVVDGVVTTNVVGNVFASDGTSLVLDSGTDGTDATFVGDVTGDISASIISASTSATLPTDTSIGDVSSTEIGYLNGVTSNIQTQINTAVPTGAMMMWYTASAPTGWIFCHGQSTASYPALAAVIGANVPDLQTRVPIGRNSAGTGTFGTLKATGGTESVTLVIGNIPSHTHAIDHDHPSITTGGTGSHSHSGTTGGGGSHSHSYSDAGRTSTLVASGSTKSVGTTAGVSQTTDTEANHTHSMSLSGGSHDHSVNIPSYAGTSGTAGSLTPTPISTLQPYLVVNYIIKT